MNTSRLGRATVAGAFAAAALFAATACSSTTGYTATPTAPVQQVPPGAVTPSAGGGLTTAENATLGTTVLTDAAGMTLYRSDNDKNIPPTSNCTDTCATMWLPVGAVSDTQVKNVDQNLLGSLQRADGTKQLTVGGWPVYRYSGDTAAGDIKGEKVDGVWFAAAPDGTKAGESSDGAAAGSAATAGTASTTTGSNTTTTTTDTGISY